MHRLQKPLTKKTPTALPTIFFFGNSRLRASTTNVSKNRRVYPHRSPKHADKKKKKRRAAMRSTRRGPSHSRQYLKAILESTYNTAARRVCPERWVPFYGGNCIDGARGRGSGVPSRQTWHCLRSYAYRAVVRTRVFLCFVFSLNPSPVHG